MSKHVYYDGNSEWIVAESKEEAAKIWRDETGYTEEDISDDELDMIKEPDDKELGITLEDDEALKGLTDDEANELIDKEPTTGLKRITKTCGEWAKTNSKGLLCSSEF